MTEPRPERVRVTGPLRPARRHTARTAAGAIDDQTPLGALYMRTLIRAQARLALAVGGGVVLALVGLPVLFAVLPGTASATLGGVPIPWLVLGLAVYPVLWLAARSYVVRAERIERDFVRLLGPRG